MSLRHLYKDLSSLKIYGDIHGKVISDSYVSVRKVECDYTEYKLHIEMYRLRDKNKLHGLQWIEVTTRSDRITYATICTNITIICNTENGKIVRFIIEGGRIKKYNDMVMDKDKFIELVLTLI